MDGPQGYSFDKKPIFDISIRNFKYTFLHHKKRIKTMKKMAFFSTFQIIVHRRRRQVLFQRQHPRVPNQQRQLQQVAQ